MSGIGSSLNASKDVGVGVTDFVFTCGSEPVMDTMCTAVVVSARTGRMLDGDSDRGDRSFDLCYVGETR